MIETDASLRGPPKTCVPSSCRAADWDCTVGSGPPFPLRMPVVPRDGLRFGVGGIEASGGLASAEGEVSGDSDGRRSRCVHDAAQLDPNFEGHVGSGVGGDVCQSNGRSPSSKRTGKRACGAHGTLTVKSKLTSAVPPLFVALTVTVWRVTSIVGLMCSAVASTYAPA